MQMTCSAGLLAIEMDADAINFGQTTHPYPMLGKSIGMAAEVAHGFVPICRHSKRRHGKHGRLAT